MITSIRSLDEDSVERGNRAPPRIEHRALHAELFAGQRDNAVNVGEQPPMILRPMKLCRARDHHDDCVQNRTDAFACGAA